MRVTARVNIDLAKSTNYIPMGYWSNTSDYYISEAGIPFVKREDGTALGYSVYALNVDQATKGSWIASQWRLLESAEFLYMQDAYIERLQAALVTAEKIQALNIKTGNLEALNGAKIGNFEVLNGILTATHQWSTYIGTTFVFVTSRIEIRSDKVSIFNSYGGTTDHPTVVEWYSRVTPTKIEVGQMEVRRDGIYRNGVKVL